MSNKVFKFPLDFRLKICYNGINKDCEVTDMSEKEKAIKLLDTVPPYKLGYVIAYIQGITADEDADDLFCQKMADDYLSDPDPEKDEEYDLEDCKKEWGIVNAGV